MGASHSGSGAEELDDVPAQEEEIATHQEAVPVPYVAGTRRVAARWLDDGIDMRVRQTSANYSKK